MCFGYTNFLLAQAHGKSLPVAMASVLPCFVIYNEANLFSFLPFFFALVGIMPRGSHARLLSHATRIPSAVTLTLLDLQVGKHIIGRWKDKDGAVRDSHPYKKWIEMYGGPDFDAATREACGIWCCFFVHSTCALTSGSKRLGFRLLNFCLRVAEFDQCNTPRARSATSLCHAPGHVSLCLPPPRCPLEP